MKINSKYYDGQDLVLHVKINTAYDKPITKQVTISKLPNYSMEVGLCLVAADDSYPTGEQTHNGIIDMEACRDLCIQ